MKRFTILVVLFAAALLSLGSTAQAADKVWTGAGATRFVSDGANWQDGTAPGPGDRLFFPHVAQTLVENDVAGASFDSFTFSGDGSVYGLYGLPLTLTGQSAVTASGRSTYFITLGITFAASDPTIATTGLPTGDNEPVIQFSQARLVFSGGTVHVSGPVGEIAFEGDIGETAQTSFEVTGDAVWFDGNNSFTGSVLTFARVTSVDSPTGLGTNTAATFLAGASLDLSSPDANELVIAEPLSLMSNFVDPIWGNVVVISPGPVRLTGSIVLTRNQVFMPAAPLIIDGAITGPGGLEVGRADNVLTLTNSANSFTGGVSVTRGTLRAGNSMAIPAGSTISVTGPGTLDLGQTSENASAFSCSSGALAATLGSGVLQANGSIALSNCTLRLAIPAGFIPQSRQVMTVVGNGSGQPFNEQFVGYPEGTVVDVNGVRATATYFAGQGNDFALVAEVIPAVAIYAIGGTPQAVAAAATAYPFVAVARDAWGRLASGARVTFTAPPGCGTFGASQSAAVTADAQGVATSPAFTAGSTSQICFVQAEGDAGGSASFELHVYALADLTFTPLPASLSTIVNQPFTVGAELRANGMTLPFLTLTFQVVTRGNAGVASLTSYAFTDPVTSRAVVTGLANGKSGNYSIVVRFGTLSLTIPVSQKAQ